MKALIICTNESMAWALPAILARAGFSVDIVTREKILKSSRFVHSVFLVPPERKINDVAREIVETPANNYDWIIVTEDHLLAEILELAVNDDLKLKMLPVTSTASFPFLHSKIGFSHACVKHDILTPRFKVVTTLEEALTAAEELGFPFMLKIDSSGGGRGVYECKSKTDIVNLEHLFNQQSLLAQEKITGAETDLSALFLDGHLLFFNYSKVLKTIHPRGPSSLRDYTPMHAAPSEIMLELTKLGHALGAHGFTNITCIETADKKRYYFEGDLRPNAWVGMTTFFGDDPAASIRRWFENKIPLTQDFLNSSKAPRNPVRVPYFMRMQIHELLLNKHAVWRFIPTDDVPLVFQMLKQKFTAPLRRWAYRYATLEGLKLHLLNITQLYRVGRIFVPRKFIPQIKTALSRRGLYQFKGDV